MLGVNRPGKTESGTLVVGRTTRKMAMEYYITNQGIIMKELSWRIKEAGMGCTNELMGEDTMDNGFKEINTGMGIIKNLKMRT